MLNIEIFTHDRECDRRAGSIGAQPAEPRRPEEGPSAGESARKHLALQLLNPGFGIDGTFRERHQPHLDRTPSGALDGRRAEDETTSRREDGLDVRHLGDHLLEFENDLVRFFRGRTGGQRDERTDVAVVDRRQKRRPQITGQPPRTPERGKADHDDRPAELHDAGPDCPIGLPPRVYHAIDEPDSRNALHSALHLELCELRGQGRYHGERDEERGQDRKRDRENQLAEDQRRQPGDEQEGYDGSQVRGGRCDDGTRNF